MEQLEIQSQRLGRNTEEKERLLQNVKDGWKLLNQQIKELAVCEEEESWM